MMDRTGWPSSRPTPPSFRRRLAGGLALLLGLGLGCSAHHETNQDLDALLAAYRQNAAEIEARRSLAADRGIERLEVRPQAGPEVARVDLDVRDAKLARVVERLVAGAGLDLALGPTHLVTRTTARISDRPLSEVLDLLLAPEGFEASIDRGVVRVAWRTVPEDAAAPGGASAEESDDETPSPAPVGTPIERRLRFADPESIASIFQDLYPEDADGIRPLNVAARPETSSIFLSGPAATVNGAARLLDRLDTDQPHVFLEALVVEFNTQSFLNIGSRIVEGSTGRTSNIFLDVASLVGNTLSFTRTADAASTTTFTAIINLLLQKEEARVISRPWLTTLSGIPAQIEIAEDRYLVTQVPGFEVNLDQVSSGVTMDITPTVTADGSIRLQISITESQFIPSLEDVEQRRSRNSVSTTTLVDDGGTAIIGGLMLKRRGGSKAGIPFLRDIFPFSWVLGHEDYSDTDSQVMVYVTPHLWQPGMDPPLPATDDFEVYPLDGRPSDGAASGERWPRERGQTPNRPRHPSL